MSGRAFVIDIGNIYRVYKRGHNVEPVFEIDVCKNGIWHTQDNIYQFHEMLNIIVGQCNISGHEAAIQLLNDPNGEIRASHGY